MTWFLIIVISLVAIAGVAALVFLAGIFRDEGESERARIEAEVRRAERRLHEVARNSFQALLDEARTRGTR
jgi:hypothetical protein